MDKNYLRYVPVEKQWDIIRDVINHYGHRTDIIIEMVDDGYPITNELLELLYRLRSFDTIKSLMYRIDEELSHKSFLDSTKMTIFKKALGEEVALSLREEIVESRKQEQHQKEQQEKLQIEASVEELYKQFSLKDKFFEGIVSSEKMMTVALEKYNRDAVIKGIAKTGKAKTFLIGKLSPEDLVRNNLYEEALTVLFIFDIRKQLEVLMHMSQTEDGFSAMMKSNNSTVEEDVTYLAKRYPELKEKFKAYGVRGYWFLYNSQTMTEEDFEQWCKLAPEAVVHYKEFNKNLFWVIKNGYFKYLY